MMRGDDIPAVKMSSNSMRATASTSSAPPMKRSSKTLNFHWLSVMLAQKRQFCENFACFGRGVKM